MRKFSKSRWFLITLILFMMGYSMGLDIAYRFFGDFLRIFESSFTEKQYDQLSLLYTSHKYSFALFFAFFIWMLSVCIILIVQKFIAEAKEQND